MPDDTFDPRWEQVRGWLIAHGFTVAADNINQIARYSNPNRLLLWYRAYDVRGRYLI